MPRTPRRLALALGLTIATTGAFAGEREDVRAGEAVRVVEQIQSIPESAIPDRLLDEAKGIIVVPDTIKAGFVIGGRTRAPRLAMAGDVAPLAPLASISRRMLAQALVALISSGPNEPPCAMIRSSSAW